MRTNHTAGMLPPEKARPQLEQETARTRLLALADRLAREVRELTKNELALAEVREQEGWRSADEDLAASDLAEGELTATLQWAARRRLGDVNDALRRLETGVYGDCECCGETIDAALLAVHPWVRFCLACQRRTLGQWENGG